MASQIYRSIKSEASFQPERFSAKVLAESANTKVVLACFEPGQFIPVHTPEVDLTLIVLEGKGRVMAGNNEHPLEPETLIFVPAGEKRGILAETKLVALHVVSPPPTEKDHKGVMEGLQRGRWKE